MLPNTRTRPWSVPLRRTSHARARTNAPQTTNRTRPQNDRWNAEELHGVGTAVGTPEADGAPEVEREDARHLVRPAELRVEVERARREELERREQHEPGDDTGEPKDADADESRATRLDVVRARRRPHGRAPRRAATPEEQHDDRQDEPRLRLRPDRDREQRHPGGFAAERCAHRCRATGTPPTTSTAGTESACPHTAEMKMIAGFSRIAAAAIGRTACRRASETGASRRAAVIDEPGETEVGEDRRHLDPERRRRPADDRSRGEPDDPEDVEVARRVVDEVLLATLRIEVPRAPIRQPSRPRRERRHVVREPLPSRTSTIRITRPTTKSARDAARRRDPGNETAHPAQRAA